MIDGKKMAYIDFSEAEPYTHEEGHASAEAVYDGIQLHAEFMQQQAMENIQQIREQIKRSPNLIQTIMKSAYEAELSPSEYIDEVVSPIFKEQLEQEL